MILVLEKKTEHIEPYVINENIMFHNIFDTIQILERLLRSIIFIEIYALILK
jgi:hypothetical protein